MAAIFGGLQEDTYDRQYTDVYLARRLGSYFGQYRSKVVAIVIGFVLVSLVSALPPVLIAEGVEILESRGEIDIVWIMAGVLFIAAIVQYFANWLRRQMLTEVIGTVVATLRKDAFAAAVERDLAFYDTNKSGKIVSRITSDTQEFGDVVLIVSDVLAQMVQIVVLFAVLFTRSLPLTLVLLATLPFIVGAATIFRHFARIATRQGSRAMAAVNDTIQESVSGISIAKNFRREAMIYDEFKHINWQSYTINMRRGFVLALIFPALNVLAGLAIALIMLVGAQYVDLGWITVGGWFLFILGVDRFWFPFINLAAVWSQFQQAMSAIERIFALVDSDNTIVQHDTISTDGIKGHIELRNVTFGYTDDQPVLEHFNLTLQEGENVAFVGHTGAGKSTIAKIISRFYEFQSGDVLIDGQDIRAFDIKSYRSRLGIVPQAPFLFSGTIRDNIRYGRPETTDEEIREIAYSIGDGEWLETLPDGLDTDVGERGSYLSMGQRQLVSLMRVLVEKPAIFILDEATASVDPFTETQIQEAIDLILSKSTSILIAHRLSTIRNADRIIVLRDGKIIEEGNHDHLMDQGGHYAELYNTYFRHQSLSYIENARSLFADG